jgi:hypothetical protein
VSKNQSQSDRLASKAGKNFTKAAVAPVKAIAQIFTSKGSGRITKPAATLLTGAADLFKGFINLTASALADFANPKKFKQRPKLTPQEKQQQTVQAKERIRQKYKSLIDFVPPEPKDDPKQPNDFVPHIAKDGVTILPHRQFNCMHKHCEGDGTFIVTEGQLADYTKNGLYQPKSCYPCRLWVYQQELAGDRNFPCEVCGKPIFFRVQSWIMYHKKEGKPLASRKCRCIEIQRALQQRERRLIVYGNDARDMAKNMVSTYVPKKGKRTKGQMQDARKQALEYIKNNQEPPLSGNLVDISDLTTNHNDHFYHQLIGGNKKETRYEHIARHVNGIVDTTMGKYETALKVIRRAHEIAKVDVPNRYLEISEDIVDGQPKTHKKFDLVTGEMQAEMRSGKKYSTAEHLQQATDKFIGDISENRMGTMDV